MTVNGRRLGVGGVLAALVLLPAAATPVAEAGTPKPKNGCWGRCGGDQGPVGGYFVVAGGHVTEFGDGDQCLGKSNGIDDVLTFSEYMTGGTVKQIKLPIKNDRFSFKGDAWRTATGAASESGGAETTYVPTHVELSGKFVSATKALVTLTIHDAACGTKHLTIKAAQ